MSNFLYPHYFRGKYPDVVGVVEELSLSFSLFDCLIVLREVVRGDMVFIKVVVDFQGALQYIRNFRVTNVGAKRVAEQVEKFLKQVLDDAKEARKLR